VSTCRPRRCHPTNLRRGRLDSDGLPAVTRRQVGSGAAWYVATRLDDDAYVALLATVAEEAGVAPLRPRPPPGGELVRRTTDGQSWLVAINHGSRPYALRADGLDLLTGRPVKPTDALPSGTALVLRESGRGTR
jgi:beta-galactosidase